MISKAYEHVSWEPHDWHFAVSIVDYKTDENVRNVSLYFLFLPFSAMNIAWWFSSSTRLTCLFLTKLFRDLCCTTSLVSSSSLYFWAIQLFCWLIPENKIWGFFSFPGFHPIFHFFFWFSGLFSPVCSL